MSASKPRKTAPSLVFIDELNAVGALRCAVFLPSISMISLTLGGGLSFIHAVPRRHCWALGAP
jgi:ATP-dependent Zn protease